MLKSHHSLGKNTMEWTRWGFLCLPLAVPVIIVLQRLSKAEEVLSTSTGLCASLLAPAKYAGIIWGPRSLLLSVADNLLGQEDAERESPPVRRNKYGDVVE